MDIGFHVCARGERSELKDARGIFCCFVCPVCEKTKRERFRPEIFNDPAYEADELIDGDD